MASTCGVKFFEKKLNEGDIKNGLVLEVDSESALLPAGFNSSHVEFYAMDEEHVAWRFRCRAGGATMKTVLILEGWAEFVRHYGLRVKDKVLLYHNYQGREANVVIHVRRTIRLFGVDITEAD